MTFSEDSLTAFQLRAQSVANEAMMPLRLAWTLLGETEPYLKAHVGVWSIFIYLEAAEVGGYGLEASDFDSEDALLDEFRKRLLASREGV